MEEQKNLEPLQPERQEEHHAFQEFMSPRPDEIRPNEVNPADTVRHDRRPDAKQPIHPLDPEEPLEPEKDQPYGPSGPSKPAEGYRTGEGK